ncbi:protein DBF4 homolog A [Boleophthalmus pectinirostris]|uniref:protein DBF4 homolog A n=1 Tax=Boleophthalmus pectinirostris TaxID=150288 RepID=UPI00242A8591|nr:protein DBF4 homolog A [Boleophthalmus pectinirostris]
MKENIMKPKHNKRGLPDCDKRALIQTRATPCAPQTPRPKPFMGKVFYLDLTSNKVAETLESDIILLGGTVEKFFSKEIKYLVSNKREAKYVQCLRQDSPVPSPESGPSSPQLCSGDSTKSTSQLQKDTVAASRGKSLVKKVVKEQERIQMNKILSNALEWGVKILYLDDVMSYVQKKKKSISCQQPAPAVAKTNVKKESTKHGFQKSKGGRISRPFVKVEDSSRHYRPFYLRLTNVPEFNLSTHPPCTPFCLENKDAAGDKVQCPRAARASASDERPNERKKKKQGGYCECCLVKYDNIKAHLQSDRHQTFAKSDEYLIVDKLVSAMCCKFTPIRSKLKRPKCSVSSVLIAPGPFVETTSRAVDRDDSAMKLELNQSQNGERREEQSSIPALKTSSAAPPVGHTIKKRRKECTFSDSKHKQPSRQTLTSNIEKHRSHRKEELAPPTGDSAAPRTAVSTADLSHSHSPEAQTLSRRFILNETSAETKQEPALCTAGKLVHEQSRENCLSLKEHSSEDFVPEEKIKRKIKVYKRKRRKMLIPLVTSLSVELSDGLTRLCELFQDSDDMDVEFHGFE